MDALSVLSLLANLISVIEVLGKSAKFIWRISVRLKAARKHLKVFANEMSIFTGLLSMVHKCLKDHHSRCERSNIFYTLEKKMVFAMYCVMSIYLLIYIAIGVAVVKSFEF